MLLAQLSLILLVAAVSRPAAALTSTLQTITNWGGSNPTALTMGLYVPTTVLAKPPVILALHYCGGTGELFFQTTEFAALADTYGFIVIFPTATRSSQCWDCASATALVHDGNSDPATLANMVKYVQTTYNGDTARTFVAGHSSGGMTTQVMIGDYPELFAAGAELSGVPFSCFYTTDSSLWNQSCASGTIVYTAAQWAANVTAAYPSYTGTRPRIMLWHGTLDLRIAYANHAEAIKQWTYVHGLSVTPTSSDNLTSTYVRTRYGSANSAGKYLVEAVSVVGGPHDILVTGVLAYVMDFFGISGSTATTTTRAATTTTTTTTTRSTAAASSSTTTTTRTTTTSVASTTTTSSRASTTTTTMASPTTTSSRASTTTTMASPTTSRTSSTTTTTTAASTATNCVAQWGQCGGLYWTGSTTCCSTTCTYQNDWYSQCL